MTEALPQSLQQLLAGTADKSGVAVIIDIPGSSAHLSCQRQQLPVLSLRPHRLTLEYPELMQTPNFSEGCNEGGFYDFDWLAGNTTANLTQARHRRAGEPPYLDPLMLKLRRLDDELLSLRKLSWLHICDSSFESISNALLGGLETVSAHQSLLSLDLRSCADSSGQQFADIKKLASRAELELAVAAPDFIVFAPKAAVTELQGKWQFMQRSEVLVAQQHPINQLGTSGFRELEQEDHFYWCWTNESAAKVLVPQPLFADAESRRQLRLTLHHFDTNFKIRCFLNHSRTELLRVESEKHALTAPTPQSAFFILNLVFLDFNRLNPLGLSLHTIAAEYPHELP